MSRVLVVMALLLSPHLAYSGPQVKSQDLARYNELCRNAKNETDTKKRLFLLSMADKLDGGDGETTCFSPFELKCDAVSKNVHYSFEAARAFESMTKDQYDQWTLSRIDTAKKEMIKMGCSEQFIENVEEF